MINRNVALFISLCISFASQAAPRDLTCEQTGLPEAEHVLKLRSSAVREGYLWGEFSFVNNGRELRFRGHSEDGRTLLHPGDLVLEFKDLNGAWQVLLPALQQEVLPEKSLVPIPRNRSATFTVALVPTTMASGGAEFRARIFDFGRKRCFLSVPFRSLPQASAVTGFESN